MIGSSPIESPGSVRPLPRWSDGAPSVRTGEGLRRLYAEYRRREAVRLLALVPREAIRSLLRAARADAVGGAPPPEGDDALDGLVAWVDRSLLPLPPFDVWLRDFQRHRDAYLAEIAPAAPRAPEPDLPVTVEMRTFPVEGRDWVATLDLRLREERWGGAIVFSLDGELRARTAEIFREDDPDLLRRRFLELGGNALAAFLRSALP